MIKKYKYLIIVFLIVASFIAFGRIAGNDFVNYDDDKYITENIHIQTGFNAESIKWAFTNSKLEYWHPLTWLSIMLDWRLFGANASGHHLVSLLLHIGAVLFLFLFLNKATKQLWPSAFVAALFALHPLRVESVAWAAERKDVLSMFFGMATLYAYVFYVEEKKISKYLLCLFLYVLSLMSKPTLATLPCVLLLLDYWPLARWQNQFTPVNIPVETDKKPGKKKNKQSKATAPIEKKISAPAKSEPPSIVNILREKVPFLLLAMLLSIMIIWQSRAEGKFHSLQITSFSDRIMNALISYVSYLGKTFWPVDLAVFYPYQHSFQLWQVLSAASVLLVISIAVIYLAKRAPFLVMGWFWYLGTLFPVIGLMQAGDQAMADRYSYFPSVGIGIMVAWGFVSLLPKENLRKIILFPAAGIVLTILSILTWQQCGYWKNSISLFSHALKVTEDNYIANTNLGVALDDEGKKEEAIDHYYAALKINPNFDKAHYNMANVLKERGNMEEALKHFQNTLLIDPNFPDAHNNIGIILEKYYKKYDEAIYHYEQELKINDNPGTHFNLGIALAKKGELSKSAEQFREALLLKPDYEEARRALKLALEIERQQKF